MELLGAIIGLSIVIFIMIFPVRFLLSRRNISRKHISRKHIELIEADAADVLEEYHNNSIFDGASMFKDILEYEGFKYKYLGNGCKATGAEAGWRMSPELYFKCVDCGYLMNGDTLQDDLCKCGKLYKDIGMGRFGSRLGDDAIEVYRKV